MRKKSSILLAGLLALSAGSAKADEGMWTLYNLPQAVYEQMKTYGFNLPYDALYSGDDMTSAAFLMLGGHGVISVTANVTPRAMHELCAAAAADDARRLREVNARLVPLHRDLFCEANPIPVKWAVARMGHIGFGIRLPLTPLSESQHERVLSAMRAAGIDV